MRLRTFLALLAVGTCAALGLAARRERRQRLRRSGGYPNDDGTWPWPTRTR